MAKLLSVTLLIFVVKYCVANNQGPQLCTFSNTETRGLCVDMFECEVTQKSSASTNTKAFPKSQNCRRSNDVCCPLSKSEIKCLTYYPQSNKRISGGVKARPQEFPHMAAVGYGNKNNIQWLCGGSLISEQFVLTAAHCVNSAQFGSAKWVTIGDLDLQETNDEAQPQNFSIVQSFVHPDYKTTSHYQDIALLKLNRPAKFTNYVKPICLQIEKRINPKNLIVTGWGKTELLGDSSSHLLKASLYQIDQQTCDNTFRSVSNRRLSRGILEDIQLCAGHPEGRDTCPGDSGGPLQYLRLGNPGFFRIVGITSFGKGCGLQNSVGVYTRVSNYVRWIEDIVWPDF